MADRDGSGAINEQPPAPRRRVVVIGASNVALGIASLIPACEFAWGTPLEFFLVGGHGRALGEVSRVLGRELPPVLECQLWQALKQRPTLPTACLLTDLGTDLVFGATPQAVLRRCGASIERLNEFADRVVVTQLPAESVERVSPLVFRMARLLLFPSATLTQARAVDAMRAVNAELQTFPARYGCYLAAPEASWYGIDPIHVKRRCYPEMWQSYLAPWADFRQTKRAAKGSFLRMLRLWRQLRPAEQTSWGRTRRTKQPCARTKEGASFFLY